VQVRQTEDARDKLFASGGAVVRGESRRGLIAVQAWPSVFKI